MWLWLRACDADAMRRRWNVHFWKWITTKTQSILVRWLFQKNGPSTTKHQPRLDADATFDSVTSFGASWFGCRFSVSLKCRRKKEEKIYKVLCSCHCCPRLHNFICIEPMLTQFISFSFSSCKFNRLARHEIHNAFADLVLHAVVVAIHQFIN